MVDALGSVLREGLTQVPDALGALVLDHDGLVVAETPSPRHEAAWLMLVTELTASVRDLTRCIQAAGPLKQLTVTQKNVTTLIAPLRADTFLAVSLSPDAIVGRSQFFLTELLLQLQAQLLAA